VRLAIDFTARSRRMVYETNTNSNERRPL